jgi:hypothetical protein
MQIFCASHGRLKLALDQVLDYASVNPHYPKKSITKHGIFKNKQEMEGGFSYSVVAVV